jgi:two-component system cell cycle sensor histidine kinase/response regulator CckA
VLTNLVMNAVQASQPGGAVSVRVTELDVVRTPSARHRAGRYVVLEVEDQGRGIPADAASRDLRPVLHEPSRRRGNGPRTRRRVRDRRGARRLVAVGDRARQGSCFTVLVPAGDVDEPSILIVDDDEAMRDMLRARLGRRLSSTSPSARAAKPPSSSSSSSASTWS